VWGLSLVGTECAQKADGTVNRGDHRAAGPLFSHED
jgi:hypothetical protein